MTPDDLCLRAAHLRSQGQDDEAERLFHRALLADPDHLNALANLRDIFAGQRKFSAALAIARRVVAAVPHDGVQWDRLASAYMLLDRFPEARAATDRALELAPDNPLHWHQSALLAHRLGDSETALAHARAALELNPYGLDLLNDRAHMLMAAGGDLAAALEAYEVRWATLAHLHPWDLHIPEWKGESLAGNRVLFHSEQGLGDAIMMARFARDLVAAGAAQVGLCLPCELTRLFQVQRWPGVKIVDLTVIDRDDWDLQTPMFSGFRWLGMTRGDIDGSPYLTNVPKVIVPALPTGFRVGVCWASGRWNVDTGMRRMVPFSLILEELGSVPGVRLVSLQKGDDARDLETLGAVPLVANPMPACDDFAATAAVVAQLDVVITVDTAILHLAAAMGKPTFMLCQFTRCWRWWSLPNGAPWYQTMIAGQQSDPHDWRGPVYAARDWVAARNEGGRDGDG